MTNTKFTAAQANVLKTLDGRKTTHSGRGGWSANTMRALAQQGLFVQGREHTWETDWHLTDKGRLVVAVGEFFQSLRNFNRSQG